ncbi:proteasome activator complex subunit 3-like [Zophobas morio]|jgi:proteasome activator subunit 3 (PA28 gamma)|uniref:proteasome activator complex subunit 3-like n=1 Tax=Zophobas morio TaxID=2755281 RepID=UPI003082FACC
MEISKIDCSASVQVKTLCKGFADKALDILHNKLPEKVIHLDKLYQSIGRDSIPDAVETELFSLKSLEKVNLGISENNEVFETTLKKRKLVEAEVTKVSSNLNLLNRLKVVKMEILQLIEYCKILKTWIQLLIPRIEDGNNFGVSIQEDTINEISRVEGSGFSALESIANYLVTRGKLVSKILKYPQIQDYQLSISELDEKEYIDMLFYCVDLRDIYTTLHDMIIKNIEKIKKPRSSNSNTSMY